jgi:hypothetical protein
MWMNGRKIKQQMERMEDGKYEGENERNKGRKNAQRKKYVDRRKMRYP